MGSSSSKVTQSVSSRKSMASFYSLAATKGDGSIQKMDEFRGKVVYATNVASK